MDGNEALDPPEVSETQTWPTVWNSERSLSGSTFVFIPLLGSPQFRITEENSESPFYHSFNTYLDFVLLGKGEGGVKANFYHLFS